jgi:hypothetical protein
MLDCETAKQRVGTPVEIRSPSNSAVGGLFGPTGQTLVLRFSLNRVDD